MDYFNESGGVAGLKGKTIRGGAYTVASQVVRGLISLVSIPILARLLHPSDFGLIAMVAVVTGLANLFVDGGLTSATVQREKLTEPQSTNMFWLSAALGGIVALVVVAISPLVAWFFRDPRLVGITAAKALAFLFSGLMIQHQALLRRSMQFDRLAWVQIGSSIIGQGTTIVAAWYFRNYWALVIMPIAGAFVRMVLTWIACPWRPGLPRRGSGVRSMLAMGGQITAGRTADVLSMNIEKLLLGRFLGAEILGNYDQSWRLLNYPLGQINGPVAAVAVPALSRLQEKNITYRQAYIKGLTAIALVTIPFLAVAIAAPDWVILTVLTKKFEEAIPIFQVLAIACVLFPITNSLGWLFVSQGRVSECMRLQIADFFVKTLLVSVGLIWGVMGVMWALVIRRVLYVAVMGGVAGRTGPVSRQDLGAIVARQVLIVAIGSSVGFITRQFLPPNLAPWQGLALISGPCVASCLMGFACLRSMRELLFDCVRYMRPAA